MSVDDSGAVTKFTDKTAFGINEKFDQVSDDAGVPTQQFLKACVDFAAVLDRLGSGFSVPKKDIIGNIKKVEEKFKSDEVKFSTLRALVVDVSENQKKSSKITSMAASLLWLKRGLDFLLSILDLLSKDYHAGTEDHGLRQTIVSAYEGTLQPFHGKMIRFLFSNVSRLSPYRDSFLATLKTSEDATVDMVISDIDLFLPNASDNVRHLEGLLSEHNLNVEDKVS